MVAEPGQGPGEWSKVDRFEGSLGDKMNTHGDWLNAGTKQQGLGKVDTQKSQSFQNTSVMTDRNGKGQKDTVQKKTQIAEST